jgi:hypothetical protein
MARDIRLEPRGFDEQWAANAAEIEQWRSVDHGKARELHDAAPQRRGRDDSSRHPPRPRRIAFTVVAGGLAVGGLVLYLLITLSGIGPPKQLTRQAEEPTQAVDAKREVSRKPAAAPMTLEDRQREEEKRSAPAFQRNVVRKAGLSTAPGLVTPPDAPDQKEQAWQRFYQPSENCQANEGRGTMACVNEFARAKMEFEQRWAEGRL